MALVKRRSTLILLNLNDLNPTSNVYFKQISQMRQIIQLFKWKLFTSVIQVNIKYLAYEIEKKAL